MLGVKRYILLFLGLTMQKMFLFSEVKGTVIRNGRPVVGAIVEQEFSWAWTGQVGHTETKTDINGNFSFPVITRYSFFGALLPHEKSIRQTIKIKHDNILYQAWMFDKEDYLENGELKKPISLLCDLDAPLTHTGLCQ